MSATVPKNLKKLLSYIRPYWLRMLIGVVLVAYVGMAEGVVLLMIKPVVDQVLNPAASVGSHVQLVKLAWDGKEKIIYLDQFFPPQIHYVWTIVAISLLVVYATKAIAEYLGLTQIHYVGHSAVTDLRNRVYAKLIRQPIGFFQHTPTGRLISATISDVERARVAMSEYLADLFQKGFSLIAFLIVLLITNWKMALASAVLLPFVVWPVGKLGRKIRRSAERTQTNLADLSQIIQETATGNRVVKAFGMEEFEIHKFREVARRLLRENMRWVRAAVVTSPIMDLLGAIIIPLLLLYARGQIRDQHMTLGQFTVFLFALFSAYMPVKRMGYIYEQFQMAQGATAQVFAYLDLAEEVKDRPGARTLAPCSEKIVFDNVSFSYDSAPVLHGIDLTARKGEVVALVGSSGAGKTTLVNLLPRFYDVTGGAVTIDGTDIREVTLRSLRDQIAMVTQENILFHDTVWNNICYGRPEMDETRLVESAKAAMAHDFIMELPQGYQTIIGERGQRLSGGQRQRIAIARAILKNSPILILDEATSELDAESEMLVQKALANLMVGRTSFVIAHRLSTIRRADRILVLEDGQILEEGTHAELLAGGRTYARLYDLQFADDENPAVITANAATPAPNVGVAEAQRVVKQ